MGSPDQNSPEGIEANFSLPSAITSFMSFPFSSLTTCHRQHFTSPPEATLSYLVQLVVFNIQTHALQDLGDGGFVGVFVPSQDSKQVGGHVTHFLDPVGEWLF